ncbi:hypothetical protein CK203_038963 [Vitis vinifera]|uniref:Reverse transcriptase zinc-binding domain-containing protein n=1 Tax=Vitis vinifera TaxID=29760 RepID=A0A438HLN2_VITVI|nr:hypothetical protein CK203_038963 [Vitis vinifera]
MGKKVGCSQEVTEVYCVGLWKWIRKDWDLMSTRISFSIGNGQRDFSIEGGWNPCFFRSFNDWEVEVVKSFLVQLHGKRVCGDVEDTVLWTKMKSG